MTGLFLALAVLATPAPQQSPAAPVVTYDEAVACAFLGIGYGLRDEHSEETRNAAVGLGARYMAYAEVVSGKDSDAVVADIGDAASAVVAQITQSAQPFAELRQRYLACEARAADLPPA
jgi:hypothetical protein